jgi:hypothetical protein
MKYYCYECDIVSPPTKKKMVSFMWVGLRKLIVCRKCEHPVHCCTDERIEVMRQSKVNQQRHREEQAEFRQRKAKRQLEYYKKMMKDYVCMFKKDLTDEEIIRSLQKNWSQEDFREKSVPVKIWGGIGLLLYNCKEHLQELLDLVEAEPEKRHYQPARNFIPVLRLMGYTCQKGRNDGICAN